LYKQGFWHADILHQIKIGITKHQPFCAGFLEINLDASMRALSFAIENNAVTEFSVPYPLSQANAEFCTGTDAIR
jgi:hypothetical protein